MWQLANESSNFNSLKKQVVYHTALPHRFPHTMGWARHCRSKASVKKNKFSLSYPQLIGKSSAKKQHLFSSTHPHLGNATGKYSVLRLGIAQSILKPLQMAGTGSALPLPVPGDYWDFPEGFPKASRKCSWPNSFPAANTARSDSLPLPHLLPNMVFTLQYIFLHFWNMSLVFQKQMSQIQTNTVLKMLAATWRECCLPRLRLIEA